MTKVFLPQLTTYSFNLINCILAGQNFLGQIFKRSQYFTDAQIYRNNIILIALLNEKQIYILCRKIIQNTYSANIILKLQNKHRLKNKQFNQYIGKFIIQNLQKHTTIAVQQKLINKICIQRLTELFDNYKNNFRITLIHELFCQFIDKQYKILLKHRIYQIIQGLLILNREKINNIRQLASIDDIVSLLKDEQVQKLNQFNVYTMLSQFQDISQLYLVLNEEQFNQVPDNLWISLLTDVQNRILKIDGNQMFVARRVSDNKIFKCLITTQNIDVVYELIEQCIGDDQYDIILIMQNNYFNNIYNIKIRYLNLISITQKINLTLKHPQCLITASLYNVQIDNLNECINLQNINTGYFLYQDSKLNDLHKLKRIRSYWDTYDNQYVSLIQKLFTQTKLEYVYIDGGDNMISDTELRENIQNLRVFSLYNKDTNANIKLYIQQKQQLILQVYDIQIGFLDQIMPILIEGQQEAVEQTTKQLLDNQHIQNDECSSGFSNNGANLILGDDMIL